MACNAIWPIPAPGRKASSFHSNSLDNIPQTSRHHGFPETREYSEDTQDAIGGQDFNSGGNSGAPALQSSALIAPWNAAVRVGYEWAEKWSSERWLEKELGAMSLIT